MYKQDYFETQLKLCSRTQRMHNHENFTWKDAALKKFQNGDQPYEEIIVYVLREVSNESMN